MTRSYLSLRQAQGRKADVSQKHLILKRSRCLSGLAAGNGELGRKAQSQAMQNEPEGDAIALTRSESPASEMVMTPTRKRRPAAVPRVTLVPS
jgi:hypothetical protein